jgi:hypothetical protein
MHLLLPPLLRCIFLALVLTLLPAVALAQCDSLPEQGKDVVSSDWAIYRPSETHPFSFYNSVWGKDDSWLNGRDYAQVLLAMPNDFPNGSAIAWTWPDNSGNGGWAYGYPSIIYGRIPGTDPNPPTGPWPTKISDFSALSVDYDIEIGGNTKSFNILLDIRLTSVADSTDLSKFTIAEISFYPADNSPTSRGISHSFTNFDAKIYFDKKSSVPEIKIVPQSGRLPTNLLSARVNLLEVLNYLISLNWIRPDLYVQGIEFGSEPQRPNSYNSSPHCGNLKIKRLSYIWRRNSNPW